MPSLSSVRRSTVYAEKSDGPGTKLMKRIPERECESTGR